MRNKRKISQIILIIRYLFSYELICRWVKNAFSLKSSKKWIQLLNIKGSIRIRINLKGRIRIHIKPKKQDPDPKSTWKWRGSATVVVEMKCSRSKNLTGKCFGNPTSWWPAAGPAQQQWWWRSTPSCSAASDRWPDPGHSTSPANSQRVHVCSTKSTSNVNKEG